ncbi:MAG: DUF1329 domain-containing protein [bacterium]|nr:DUF1329 domain-containing protein [bacterium]
MAIIVVLAGIQTPAGAKATPDEIARLGAELTPLGAEKAGNAAGTIPAWDGGITTPPEGYKSGDHHPDPYADDDVLFTITAANMADYAENLSPGHQAMLNTYDSFHMKVYPAHRSASFPQRIYDKTAEIAATAELVDGGNGVRGVINGIPFPIPESGMEVIWNHLLRYRSDIASRAVAQAAPTRSGSYTLVCSSPTSST